MPIWRWWIWAHLHSRARKICTSATHSAPIRDRTFRGRSRARCCAAQTIFHDGRITAAGQRQMDSSLHPGVRMHQLGETRSASRPQPRSLHARYLCPRAAARHAGRHGDRPRRARAGRGLHAVHRGVRGGRTARPRRGPAIPLRHSKARSRSHWAEAHALSPGGFAYLPDGREAVAAVSAGARPR